MQGSFPVSLWGTMPELGNSGMSSWLRQEDGGDQSGSFIISFPCSESVDIPPAMMHITPGSCHQGCVLTAANANRRETSLQPDKGGDSHVSDSYPQQASGFLGMVTPGSQTGSPLALPQRICCYLHCLQISSSSLPNLPACSHTTSDSRGYLGFRLTYIPGPPWAALGFSR